MPMISESTPVTFSDPLPDAVDVVVIGAGIVGTATAWFLAQRGAKVALLEKGRVAGEQSSRNWGWVRQQGRDAAELPIMMESNRIWRGLAEETGEKDLAFTASGCVYLAEDERQLAKYEEWHDLARRHQLDTRMLSKEEAREAVPGIEGKWAGGMVTPSDGRAEPFVAVPALARAARRLGVSIVESCAVRTIETAGGQIRGVCTERGPVRTERVVLAGGAWSAYFAGNAGPRSAAAHRALHRGPHPCRARPQPSERLRAGVHGAPARGRRLHRLDRRSRGALPVPALVPVFQEVSAAPEAFGPGCADQAQAPGGPPGGVGLEVALVRRRGHAVSSGCGCSIPHPRSWSADGLRSGCRGGRRGWARRASRRSGPA